MSIDRHGTVPSDWKAPEWDVHDRVHNWRNYVTTEIISLWPTFSDVQKKAIARMCDGMASTEDWD